MWPASASRASDPASHPPTASTTMNTAVKPKTSHSRVTGDPASRRSTWAQGGADMREIYPAAARKGSGAHPDPDRLRMAEQPLGLRQRDDPGRVVVEPVAGVMNDAGSAHEVVDAEGGGVARRAGGRQHVARPGDVVSNRLRAVVAQEDGAGVAHPA